MTTAEIFRTPPALKAGEQQARSDILPAQKNSPRSDVEKIFRTPIFLAPMAGVTDTAFRVLVRELLDDDFAKKNLLMFSEMVSAAGVHYRNEKTLAMLETVKEERPTAIQIFGSDPSICAEAAAYVEERGSADVIDFNSGCPAPKIFKNAEGSALMKNPALLEKILSAVKKSVSLPVSVKIRLGVDANHINAVEVAKRAESAGVDFIAVHGRTREQFYSGAANWEEIARVKAAVKIPVIANGDVRDFDSLDKIFSTTRADAVMIGRAAQGNPWIINRLLKYFLTGEKISAPSRVERAEVMRRHLEKIIFYKGERVGVREMRAHAAWYTKGLTGGAELRNLFNRAESAEDFLKIIALMEE
ncbi:MAG: tRNA dihydrouridine synthase DusB [Selenomonadaceae bacterium]|nr:tRNA dihydrouridine synthase DusB [Selenomonadaceae bacterium]